MSIRKLGIPKLPRSAGQPAKAGGKRPALPGHAAGKAPARTVKGARPRPIGG
ncbi:hypothetical protein [Streptomyces sp. NPDC093223]|uniref:hypothetical protein n=1 Tax=Streptomyces sp. NPDC093223 TaxID=3366033 RepID=UPI00380DD17F